ncbi:hypothetical protein [Halobacillus seohaensis]|uniref:Lipoprotein n=1 Tax=Halobacillus seohaensis TaxID=447421 RepID=A0ABW2EMH6_9BACI
MKKKLIILLMSVAFSTSLLSACNADNNEMNEQPEDVNYDPTRYKDEDNRLEEGPPTDPRDAKYMNEPDTSSNMNEKELDPDVERRVE